MGRRLFLSISKHLLILLSVLFIAVPYDLTRAQEKKQNFKFEFHGFIKSDYWVDTRNIAGAREKLFLLYPLRPDFDDFGNDINDEASFNFSAITSRVNTRITGPEAFGAKTEGFIEADFSGISNTDVDGFRLRHAYMSFNWENTRLLLGQYWHPMFVTDVFPTVLALNTGAPFQPFIRNPQIRVSHDIGNFELIGAMLSQLDYASDGPAGKSGTYLSNSMIPNLHFQLKWKSDPLIIGAAIDFKRIQPEDSPDPNGSYEYLDGISQMIYARLNKGRFSVKTKYIRGENLTEHLMLGGYAARFDSLQDRFTNFSPTVHHSAWLNLIYKNKSWEFAAFGGYTFREGDHQGYDKVFGRGADIEYVYRISPMVAYWIDKDIRLCIESEYTSISYDEIPYSDQANDPVKNIRFQFTGFLFF